MDTKVKMQRLDNVRVTLLVVMLLLTGCKEAPKSSDNISKESFDAFLNQFGTDSNYQSKHIAFPVTYESIDIDDSVDRMEINASEWRFIPFGKDTTAALRSVDAYVGKVSFDGDSKATYTRTGIDNGILIEYHFQEMSSEWKLVKVVDKSN